MEQFVGMSKTGSIKEAAEGLKNPQFLMLFDSSKERFKESVSQLEEMFPGVPSIGCVGQFYGKTQVLENGVMVVGFSGGIRAAADVFTDVSTMPVKCIRKFQQNVTNISASADNTVLIDFCSGNDECVLATMESVLKSKKIQLTGGTAWEGLVCCNGQVYEDACAYALVKNESGRVKVYKENIYLRKGDRIVQLKDFCRVNIVPVKEKGVSVSNGKRAVTLAVIKQADENMDKMKKSLVETMEYFQRVYPDIDFSISRNQTELLDYTISNLQQNLSLGFLFICLVAVLFLGDVKSPLVIGLSMVVSIVISFVFFYLCNMSLNIISLAGLILALGMMIDSSIIVTENISQYRERGYSLRRACITGTSEVVTPMLSSSLTTIAVFAPLIFMSGIAGAIFYDQAFSVTVGLMVSYFTGIMLLPVLYLLVYRTGIHTRKWKWLSFKFNNPIKDHTLDRFYDAGVDWVFSHKTFSVLFCAISIPLCVFFFFFISLLIETS